MNEMFRFATGEELPEMDIREFFEGIFRAEDSGREFPVDFDEVWPMAYHGKYEAKRALTRDFIEGVDFLLRRSAEQTEGSGGHNREELKLSVKCTEFFVARKRTDIFEIYRQCRKVVTEQAKEFAAGKIDSKKAWALRLFQNRNAHQAMVESNAPGYYSTLMVCAPHMGITEEEILSHDLSTYSTDRMDTSIGLMWGKEHKRLFGNDPRMARMQHPKVVMKVDKGKKQFHPWLYPNETYSAFRKWFSEVYIPGHLATYLQNKQYFEGVPKLTIASVANNVSRLLTRKNANLSKETIDTLNGLAANGYLKVTPNIAKRILPDQEGK